MTDTIHILVFSSGLYFLLCGLAVGAIKWRFAGVSVGPVREFLDGLVFGAFTTAGACAMAWGAFT